MFGKFFGVLYLEESQAHKNLTIDRRLPIFILFLLSVSAIIWRAFQNIWYIVVQLSNQIFGMLIFSLGELTKVLFWKLNTNLIGAGVPQRLLVFYLDRNMKIKDLSKNVHLPKKFCFVLQTLLGFEHAKFCQSSFGPRRPFWPISGHADSNG